jgi:O-antigen biosynthesis protein
MTLHEYAVYHGSDKGKYHKYCDFYEANIGKPKSIIEFGVLNGASLKMWRDAYPGSVVIGLDIEDKKPIEGTFVFKLDATKENWITRLQPKFDLIVDDASHIVYDQIAAFNIWWPLLAENGCYIIEDIHASLFTAYNPDNFDLFGWIDALPYRKEHYRRSAAEPDSMTVIIFKP